ncbi:MAG: hypothetical protein S4CHLAM45_06740 [Chlamydiales bacterium]|nr:hypothetical protein [Chlamydiales bacterium]MCH9620308.1 hypothetical protein [Chlamydiales bacterium]MCH9622781.1 hypothetical protein [Chlamydiales bacterium]
MTPTTYNTALNNLQTFNTSRGRDPVGNFADLSLTDEGEIQKTATTSKVAQFAATFFSLGLYQGYRAENLKQSARVQGVLKTSLTTVLQADCTTMSTDAKIAREKALKTFCATVFDTRTILLPPSFLARFFYWVLGVHNTTFKVRPLMVFGAEAQARIATIQAFDSDAVALRSSPLKASYNQLLAASQAAEETHTATVCGNSTVIECELNRKKVEEAQNSAVAAQIDTFTTKWEETDTKLVEAAVKAGYIFGDGEANTKQAISSYYGLLRNDPTHAPQRRREAQAAMTKVCQKVMDDVTSDILNALSRKELPAITLEIIEELLSSNSQKSLPLILFGIFSKRVRTESPSLANTGEEALISYQVAITGLKAFGMAIRLQALLTSVFSKIPFFLRPELPKEYASSEEDIAFGEAFEKYAALIEQEQRVHLTLMQLLSTKGHDATLTIEDYLTACNQEVASSREPEKFSFERSVQRLTNLDPNGLGVFLKEKDLPPHVKALSQDFAKQYAQALVEAIFTALPFLGESDLSTPAARQNFLRETRQQAIQGS